MVIESMINRMVVKYTRIIIRDSVTEDNQEVVKGDTGRP
jgi:hypothetical protein